MLILKFGGTSVRNASALRNVVAIVRNCYPGTNGLVVVLSATAGTTNDLLELSRISCFRDTDVAHRCRLLLDKHLQIVNELITDSQLRDTASLYVHGLVSELQELCCAIQTLEECTAMSADAVVSFGERFSTAILTCALVEAGVPVTEVPAPMLIATNDNFTRAAVNMEQTTSQCRAQILPLAGQGIVVVTQGFTGADRQGRVTTLGRGGSDASAAILGAATSAERIEIWTDVSGIFTADPRLVPEAQPIPELSLDEVRELALYGAKVLHPDTLIPAIQNNIPVVIRNTEKPSEPGTIVRSKASVSADINAVSMVPCCLYVRGTAAAIAELCSMEQYTRMRVADAQSVEYRAVILHAPADRINVRESILAQFGDATVDNICIIAVTGPAAQRADRVAAIASLAAPFNPCFLVAGAGNYSVFIGVPDENSADALRMLHRLTYGQAGR